MNVIYYNIIFQLQTKQIGTLNAKVRVFLTSLSSANTFEDKESQSSHDEDGDDPDDDGDNDDDGDHV